MILIGLHGRRIHNLHIVFQMFLCMEVDILTLAIETSWYTE